VADLRVQGIHAARRRCAARARAVHDRTNISLLGVAAAFAKARRGIAGLKELRVKGIPHRLAADAAMLRRSTASTRRSKAHDSVVHCKGRAMGGGLVRRRNGITASRMSAW